MEPGARMAFDVGKARVGVARCDDEGILPVPVDTLERDRYGADLDEAADLVEDYGAGVVYVGLPRHLSGQESASAADARYWARQLARRVRPVPVHLVDERLTTVSAHQALHEAGVRARDFRPIVDQAAAVIILDQALAIERQTAEPAGTRVRPSQRGGV